jgi:hypothetical protein
VDRKCLAGRPLRARNRRTAALAIRLVARSRAPPVAPLLPAAQFRRRRERLATIARPDLTTARRGAVHHRLPPLHRLLGLVGEVGHRRLTLRMPLFHHRQMVADDDPDQQDHPEPDQQADFRFPCHGHSVP